MTSSAPSSIAAHPPRRSVSRTGLFLAPADLRAFGDALKAKYDDLYFHLGYVTDYWVERERRADPAAPGLAARPPWGIRLAEHLDQIEVYDGCTLRRIPPDWRPQSLSGRPNQLSDTSFPMHGITLALPRFMPSSLRLCHREPPAIKAEDECVWLRPGDLWSQRRLDGPALRFAEGCRRILDKMFTSPFVVVDPKTLRVVARFDKHARVRIGPAAIAWCNSHPRHFLGDNIKPAGWVPPDP